MYRERQIMYYVRTVSHGRHSPRIPRRNIVIKQQSIVEHYPPHQHTFFFLRIVQKSNKETKVNQEEKRTRSKGKKKVARRERPDCYVLSSMVVTAAVSHLEISLLNAVAPLNTVPIAENTNTERNVKCQ